VLLLIAAACELPSLIKHQNILAKVEFLHTSIFSFHFIFNLTSHHTTYTTNTPTSLHNYPVLSHQTVTMAKDKKKSEGKKAKAAEKKQKAEKKAEKKNKKLTSKRAADDSSDAEDIDIDAVLEEYKKQQEQFHKITETVLSEPPRARAAATLLANPANANQLLLFGGEYFNGSVATFFNDLLVYYIDRDEWRSITSPNAPLPRSGHAWTRGGNQANAVYLFGGEFSSPKQGTFYHYNDFWKLDPTTKEWTRLEPKGKTPPARSGHRMTYFKQYIILFGGFQDTANQTKYLNDLWIYDTNNFVWYSPALPQAMIKPEPRSSFTLLPHEQGAVLYGGYSRVKATTSTNRQGQQQKGAQRHVMKPMVHTDCFFLRITPPPAEAPSGTPPTVRWERRKKPANAPNPPRAGATMAYHKGRGILFGGVHDVEESEEGMESEFFNTLFVWNVERNRFFQLQLKKPRTQNQGMQKAVGGRRARAKENEEELLRQLAALRAGVGIDEGDEMEVDEGKKEEGEEKKKKVVREMPVSMELPHPRFNAQLAVQDDVLYIYGGTFEKGDREFTFDDMYAIDLGRLDGCKEIFKREVEDWVVSFHSVGFYLSSADNARPLTTRKMRRMKGTRRWMRMRMKKMLRWLMRSLSSSCTRPASGRRNKKRVLRLKRLLPLRFRLKRRRLRRLRSL